MNISFDNESFLYVSKNNDNNRLIYLKSDIIEIMISNEAHEISNELFVMR